MGTIIIGTQRLAVETGQIALTNQDTFDGFYLRKTIQLENTFAAAPNIQLQLLGVSTGDMTPRFEAAPVVISPNAVEVAVRLEQAALPQSGEHIIVYGYRAEGLLPEVEVPEESPAE